MMTLRAALIGYGFAGSVFHAPLIAATEGLDLAAIVTAGHAREAGAAHPDAETLASADEVWARRQEFDLVVVATPNDSHASLAKASIDAGIPVVVDKPLGVNAAEASALTARAEAAGVPLTVFQNRRWDGDYLTVKHLVESGELGNILRFESRFERWRPEVSEGWRERTGADAGGGVLLDIGSHLVDQALQLFGPVERVFAEVRTCRPGALADDDSLLVLDHASGTQSLLWMSLATVRPGVRFRVSGDRAAYVKHGLDPQERQLKYGLRPGNEGWGREEESEWGFVDEGRGERQEPTHPGAYERYYEEVTEALRGDSPLPVDPGDAIEALTVIDASLRASREKRVVEIG